MTSIDKPKKASKDSDKPKLTDEQYAMLSRMYGLGMPYKHLAASLGISLATFERWLSKDDRLREGLLKGESSIHNEVLNTAYAMATSGNHPAMTIFYLKCRLRWKAEDDLASETVDLKDCKS